MSTSKLVRIADEFDPERCQGGGPDGQCQYKSAPGAEYCVRHGGFGQLRAQARSRLRVYQLNKWKKRVDEFSGHTELKQLHEEVGIMRMMLEQTLNQCKDSADLMRYSARVTTIVDKISSLVATIDRMDARKALDPSTLMALATEWIAIITSYVRDPEQLEELSNKLTNTLDVEALPVEKD